MDKNKRFEKKFSWKTFLVDTLFDIASAILYALGVYTFAAHADFAPGGITGLSIIINHYFKFIPIGMCTLAINVPLILFCHKALGKRFLFKTLKSMLISALMIDFVFPRFPQYEGERMLATLFAGVLVGAGLALLYSRGSSSGGSDFIVFSVKKKYPQLSIGTITLFMDGIIISLGGIVFKQIESVLFGILMTAASTIVMDKIMYGFGSGKMTIIITNKGAELAKRIGTEVDRGSTIIKAHGSFTGEERQMLMCACNKAEAIEVRNIVRSCDPRAIIMLSTIDEVYGYGFKNLEEQ